MWSGTWDSSSNGRAGDSKSLGWGFESSLSRFFFYGHICFLVSSLLGNSLQPGGCDLVDAAELVGAVPSWKVITVKRMFEFFRESKAELKKVEWPEKQEVVNSTVVVLVSLVVVSLGLGGMDALMTFLIKLIGE